MVMDMALAHAVENDPALEARMKADPVNTLKEIARPLQTDVWIYRGVVFSLGAVVLSAVLGALALSFYGKATPELVTAIGSAAVGAMAGLLAPSPGR